MNYKFETLNYRGFKIDIYPEEGPMDEREAYDHLGRIYMFDTNGYTHGYTLGDKHKTHESPRQFLAWEKELAIIYSLDFRDYGTNIAIILGYDITDVIATIHSTTRLLPTLGQDEVCDDCSNDEMDCLCRFDDYEDEAGFLFVTNEAVIKEYGDLSKKSIEKARACLLAEFNCYKEYVEDGVYWYQIEGLDESCGGFYGYNWEKNGLFDEAKGAIDWHIRNELADAKRKFWKLNSRKRYKHTHNHKQRKAA